MVYRVRLFIDFWNFQLSWNEHLSSEKGCDWRRLPAQFVSSAEEAIVTAGIPGTLQLEETRVYVSYNPDNPSEAKLRDWLSN